MRSVDEGSCILVEITEELSPALLAANRLLYERRAAAQAERARKDTACEASALPRVVTETREASLSGPTWEKCAQLLPAHLGWGSERATAVWRARQTATVAQRPLLVEPLLVAPEIEPSSPLTDSHIKVYPDLALGMLRQKKETTGRIWLLLRYLDKKGCGKIRIDEIRMWLCDKDSVYHLCGWRQMRHLLGEGNGIFWERSAEFLWLRSVAKVAYALTVEQLQGHPVALPINVLLGKIGEVRAHLYASFHSGRQRTELSAPIARETLQRLSGVGRRSQRKYEQQVGLHTQTNFAVGKPVSEDNAQEMAWLKGKALFRLTDYKGKQGVKGRSYWAWQLPNSYDRIHTQKNKGQQKRINQKLADLFDKGMMGNGESKIVKRYFADGKRAVQAWGHQNTNEVFWPENLKLPQNGRCWHVLEQL